MLRTSLAITGCCSPVSPPPLSFLFQSRQYSPLLIYRLNNKQQQNRSFTKEQWVKVLLSKGNLWQEYRVVYGVLCVCMWSLCGSVRAHVGVCRSPSVRITVEKGVDNGVVPTVRTEALSPPFFEKSQTLASILPRGMLRRRYHLLASTSHLRYLRNSHKALGLSAAWESETIHEG